MYVMYIYIYIYLNSLLTNSRTPTLLTLLTLLNRALTTNALNLLYHTQTTQPSKYIYIDIDPAYVNVSIYIYIDPAVVDTLTGVLCKSVSCGMGHTTFLLDKGKPETLNPKP